MIKNCIAITLCLGCMATGESVQVAGELTTRELVALVADQTVPAAVRIEAERALIGRIDEHLLVENRRTVLGRDDPEALRLVFREFNQFVHNTQHGEIEWFELEVDGRIEHRAPGLMYPSSGDDPEGDADRMPPHAQVYYALTRIWDYLARSAKPEAERHVVYASLLDDATSQLQLRKLVKGSRYNWTETVRESVLDVYRNRELPARLRYSAGHTLIDMHHATPPAEFAAIRESLVKIAWRDRGNELGLLIAGRLPWREPRVAVLKLDWYAWQKDEWDLSAAAMHEIDGYFDNITGRYRDSRAALTERELAIRRKRTALMQEMHGSGDDTKLREFEAELAAQRQAELEQRIELIDAWIAENRDRLEAEATAYAEAREQQHNAGQPQD